MTNPSAIAARPKGEPWHSQSAEKVLGQLGSAATGLSAKEAAQRLAANGPNNLAIVVSISFGLQVWSHHNEILGRFLRTSSMPIADCFLLLAVGAIPLLVLELVRKTSRANPMPQTRDRQ